jgi:hypothetical protein
MLDRWQVLSRYSIELPELNAAFAAGVLRGLMFLLFVGGAGWLMALSYRRLLASSDRSAEAAVPTAAATE